MAVDLHTHSTCSDGSQPPDAIVAAALAAGLRAVALTDHDNLDGIAAARRAADRAGVDLVAGTELSCTWPHGGFHLLVYFLEPRPGPLQDRLEEIRTGRSGRNTRIVGKLRDLGIDISLAEVVGQAGGEVVGRPHFARVLVRKGVVSTIGEAFDRFLASGRPAYVDRFRLAPAEAITLARASGAVPVVAHPHTLALEAADLARAAHDLAGQGLMGWESYYAEYLPEVREAMARIARRAGLVPTGGSDYHGSYKPGIEIGTGRGDMVVPDEAYTGLLEARRLLTM